MEVKEIEKLILELDLITTNLDSHLIWDSPFLSHRDYYKNVQKYKKLEVILRSEIDHRNRLKVQSKLKRVFREIYQIYCCLLCKDILLNLKHFFYKLKNKLALIIKMREV